jgi:hypothetical protein
MRKVFTILVLSLVITLYKIVSIPTQNIKEFRVENGRYFIILNDKKKYELINKEQYNAIIKNIYFIDTLTVAVKTNNKK